MARDLKKTVFEKISVQDRKSRNAFGLIKKDMDQLSSKVELMRSYLKDRDKQFGDAWKKEEKLREKFDSQVDEFTQKISQLKIALSSVRSMKNELVVMRDLAKIEERIKTSFKNEIGGYKEEVRYLKDLVKENKKHIRALEKGTVRKSNGSSVRKSRKKGSWSFISFFDGF